MPSRVTKLESMRESLVKLRQEKRTQERFAAVWEEAQQLYWDFLAGHSHLLRQNASKDITYFRENKLSVMIGIYNATKELIGRVHRDLIPESSTVDVEITGARRTSSPRSGLSAKLNDSRGESEDATKQPENFFSREWFPRVHDELNMSFSDIPLPIRGFELRSSRSKAFLIRIAAIDLVLVHQSLIFLRLMGTFVTLSLSAVFFNQSMKYLILGDQKG